MGDQKPLSILAVGVARELIERFTADCGLRIGHVEAYGSQADVITALQSQTHFDFIITSYSGPDSDNFEILRQLDLFNHCKDTPVVMLSQQTRD